MEGRKSFNLRRVRLVMTSKKAFALIAVFSVFGVLGAGLSVFASAGSVTTIVVGAVIEPFLGFLGQMLLNVVAIVIWVAQYNDFVNAAPVATGWIIVRDITNMFFIIVLLIIAFGTMLGVDQYSYRNKVLSRFLIMAIVVNFSRTICGLLIDFAQVVMLTFVNGFKEAAGGNFIEALKIGDVMQTAASGGETEAMDVVIGFIVALAMIGMSLMLMIIMLSVLVVRIIYLWLLVILSPLAFFLKAVPSPAASKYYGEWWGMFTQQVLVGPVMAFFLWLSLVSVSTGKLTAGFESTTAAPDSLGGATSAVFNAETLQEFTIAFALLLGGVMMAQRLSPKGVGLAKKAKGVAVAGAKQIDKRTGFQGMRQQRAAEREEKYKQRGSKLRSGINKPIGAMKNLTARALGSPSAKRNMNLRKMANLDKDIQQARAKGKNTDGLMADKKALQGKIDKPTSRAGKAWDKAVGIATGGAGAKEQKIIRGAGMSAIKPELDEAKTRTDAEARTAVDDASLTSSQRQAAALDLSSRKGGMESEADYNKANAAMAGADEGMKNTFAQNVARNNAAAGPESQKAWDKGNVPVDTMTDDNIAKNALKFSGSASGYKMLDKMELPQKNVLNDQLKEERKGLTDEKTLGQVESMILQTAVGKENAEAAGIKDGQFLDQNGQKSDARRERMAKTLDGPGAAKVGLAIPDDQIFNTKGEITDVGKQLGASFLNKPGALKEMGRKEGKTTEQDDTLKAIIEAVKRVAAAPPEGTDPSEAEGMKRSAANIKDMRGLEGYQQYKGVTSSREGQQRERSQQEQAAKAEAQKAEAETQKAVLKVDGEIQIKMDDMENLEGRKTEITKIIDSGKSPNLSKLQESLRKVSEKLTAVKKETDVLKKRRNDIKRKGG